MNRRWAHRLLARRRAATTAATAVASVDTASLLVVGGRGVVVNVVGRGVDADGDEAQETVLDGVAEADVVDVGVVGRGGLLGGDAVAGVLGQGLSVGVVGRGGLDLGDEGLVKEQLANVADRADRVSLVGEDRVVGTGQKAMKVVSKSKRNIYKKDEYSYWM